MTLRHNIVTALSGSLDKSPAVDGYPIPAEEMAGRNIYRIVDGALDLDEIADAAIASLGLTQQEWTWPGAGEPAKDHLLDRKPFGRSRVRLVSEWFDEA